MTKALGGFTLAILSIIGLAVIGVAAIFLSLPDVTSLKKCITTEMYHVHLCETDTSFTPYDQISPYIVGAVIMSEDAAFYSHGGVDIDEMKESAVKDFNEGRFARGGSTITQQLAKNVFLTASKNLLRKAEEIYLALQIEKHFSKKKILTYYLNVVEFGDNIYGVKAACHHYFNKSPSAVNPEEAAFLAFLLPNPKKYSQSYQRHKLTPFADKMVRTILHKMFLGNKITEGEYQVAVARVPGFPWHGMPSGAPAITETPDMAQQPPMDETPTGVLPTDNDATRLIPGADESDQSDNEFNFDFKPEDNP